MKRIILIPVLFLSLVTFALPTGWVVTVSNQTYQHLSNPTVAPLTAGWDDPSIIIPLGFTHTAAGVSTNTLYIDSNNSVGSEVATSLAMTGGVNLYSILIDPIDRATYSGNAPSSISYQTTGSAGSKVAKIQWRNIGFNGEKSDVSSLNDSTNFQMWFYESDGSVEYRFGQSSITDFERDVESTKLPLGFVTNLNFTTKAFDWFYYLAALSPVAHDSLDSISISMSDFGVSNYPANGTVIRFGPAWATGVNDGVKLNDNVVLYPTLVHDIMKIDFDNNTHIGTGVSVFDMSGKVVLSQKQLKANNIIETSYLHRGNYILQLKQKNKSTFYKFTKQ